MKNKIFSSIAFFCLVLSFLLTVIDYCSFDKSFYQKEYIQNNTMEDTGMNEEDLFETTDVLLDYLKDKRDDLVTIQEVNGVEREVFDERETLHMIDVKNLYQNAIIVRNILTVVGIICLVISIVLSKQEYASYLVAGYKYGVSLLIIQIACILVYAATDFNTFWINFHELFFDNDLYLLDPNTEILINMVPEQFFYDLVMRIILFFFIGVFALYICLEFLKRRKKQTI